MTHNLQLAQNNLCSIACYRKNLEARMEMWPAAGPMHANKTSTRAAVQVASCTRVKTPRYSENSSRWLLRTSKSPTSSGEVLRIHIEQHPKLLKLTGDRWPCAPVFSIVTFASTVYLWAVPPPFHRSFQRKDLSLWCVSGLQISACFL